MQDVPACGLTSDKRALSRKNHKVSLIYGSGVPVQAYANSSVNADQEAFQIQVIEAVLFAQYYGALKLAAQKRTGATIFLMPLGEGSFNNPWESIAAAMSRAVEMLSDEERALLDIRALTWSGNPAESSTLSRLLLMHGKLKVMNGGGPFMMNSTRGMSLVPPAAQPNMVAPSTGPARPKTEMHAGSRVEATATSSQAAELAEAARTADSVRRAAVAAQAAFLAQTAEAVEAARTGGVGPQAQSVHLRSQANASPPHPMASPSSIPSSTQELIAASSMPTHTVSQGLASAYPTEQQLLQQLPPQLQQQLAQQRQQEQQQQQQQLQPVRGAADQELLQLRRENAALKSHQAQSRRDGGLQDWRAEYFRQQQEVPVEAIGGHPVGVPVEAMGGHPVGVPVEIMPPFSSQYVSPYSAGSAEAPAHMLHRLYSSDGGPPRSLSPMPRRGSLGANMRMRSSPSPTQTTVSTTHYGEPTVRTTNVHHYPSGASPLGMSAPRHLNQPPSSPMPTHTQSLSPMPSSLGMPGGLQDSRPPMEGFQSPAAPPPWAMGFGGPSLGFGDPGRGPAYGSQDQMPRYGELGPSPYPSGPMQVPPQMGPATSYQPPPLQSPMGLDLGGGPPLSAPSGGFPGSQQGPAPSGALGMLSWSPLQAPQLIPPMLNSPMLPGLGGPPLGSPMGPPQQPQEHQLGMASPPPPPYPWPMPY